VSRRGQVRKLFCGTDATYRIWTHHMKGIEFHTDFKPEGCSARNSSQQMAATFAPGVQDSEMYRELDKYNATAVGGSNPVSYLYTPWHLAISNSKVDCWYYRLVYWRRSWSTF
jgi:hypothetical protein